MKKLIVSTALIASGLAAMSPVIADDDNESRYEKSTLAVYGDAPYGCKAPTAAAAPDECPVGSIYRPDNKDLPNPGDPRQIEATPAFIDAINKDPKVSLVVHTGDIHSGSQFCTLSYNRTVLNLWKQFKDPLVYTPGDNEWTDCQKSKEGGAVKSTAGDYVDYAAGHPVANLALVRSMFFPVAGETLGGRKKHVISQATAFDPAHPTDAEYVENVMWTQSGTVFVTLNIPGGSNNDDDQWATALGGSTKSAPQLQEVTQRNGANLRWLEAAFAKATAEGAKAVAIVEQADMWDLDGTGPSLSHIANYEPYIAKIAEKAVAFNKPVLLINGDSHKYRSDNPLKKGQDCKIELDAGTQPCAGVNTGTTEDAWDTHPSYDVPNFHRLVVHGSTFPLQYLRLTVDPNANYAASESKFGPFSWTRAIP